MTIFKFKCSLRIALYVMLRLAAHGLPQNSSVLPQNIDLFKKADGTHFGMALLCLFERYVPANCATPAGTAVSDEPGFRRGRAA